MMNNIKLSKDFSIPAIDYAGQGNAILGIRDAGKTYTAMKVAEELMDNNIPIIVYDPVGVWKNLKIGTGKQKGYPIVTAGGEESDLHLTINNAVDIVRAAMKENISLVIDLYSPELINKSTWIKIVQETVDLLMYENKNYGMRHIFIEEAAEFIPQRLQPQHAKVYASIERLARMGRNARLGYTIINQRAEEVNKAILEISSMSLLHKQVGKNSLLSITKWLDVLQLENKSDIIKSLPTLKHGECWVVGTGGNPFLIQVEKKKTFHPDPKNLKNSEAAISAKITDVSSFVEKLNNQLIKPERPGKSAQLSKRLAETPVSEIKWKKSLEEIERYKEENYLLKEQNSKLITDTKNLIGQLKLYEDAFENYKNRMQSIIPVEISGDDISPAQFVIAASKKFAEHNRKPTEKVSKKVNENVALGKCPLAILEFLASYPGRSWTKAQIGIATGYSPKSGGFNNSVSELNTLGLIIRDNGKLQVNYYADLTSFNFHPQEYSIDTFKDKLGKCEAEIYQVLLNHPRDSFTKQSLAAATESGYSYSSGGFNNSISRLNTLDLIVRQNGMIQLNPELLEI